MSTVKVGCFSMHIKFLKFSGGQNATDTVQLCVCCLNVWTIIIRTSHFSKTQEHRLIKYQREHQDHLRMYFLRSKVHWFQVIKQRCLNLNNDNIDTLNIICTELCLFGYKNNLLPVLKKEKINLNIIDIISPGTYFNCNSLYAKLSPVATREH